RRATGAGAGGRGRRRLPSARPLPQRTARRLPCSTRVTPSAACAADCLTAAKSAPHPVRAKPGDGQAAAVRRRYGARRSPGGTSTRSSTARPARLSGLRAVELADLHELEPETLHTLEQPVQGVLIVDRPAEDRLRRLDLGVEPFQPRCELLSDSPLD